MVDLLRDDGHLGALPMCKLRWGSAPNFGVGANKQNTGISFNVKESKRVDEFRFPSHIRYGMDGSLR